MEIGKGAGLIILSLLLGTMACAPAAAPQPAAPVAMAPEKLFPLACASCHGATGWGSENAPPLVGVTAARVKERVRLARGAMNFSPQLISDTELEGLAGYVPTFKPPVLAAELKKLLESAVTALAAKDKKSAESNLSEATKLAPPELKGILGHLQEFLEKPPPTFPPGREIQVVTTDINKLLGKTQ